MKYRKKPVVIEAFQVGFDKEPDWFLSRNDYEVILVEDCYNYWIQLST